MKILINIKAVSLKDSISNFGAILGLVGSLMLTGVGTGYLDKNCEKPAEAALGISAALIGYVTGKSPNLNNSNNEPASDTEKGG